MDKIFELLGIDKLDESKQEDLKSNLLTVVETKATEIAEGKVDTMLEEKEAALKEEYKAKFDTYKDGVTTKFSNFVDTVLNEEMKIPENIVKFAHLGELYEDLIEQFKVRLAIDENMIDAEVKGMLKEAKEEIEDLRVKMDEMTGKSLELQKDATEMASQIYVRQKCDGLTETQKGHVINLLEGVIVKEDIDKKFDIIIESLKIKIKEDDDDDDDDKDDPVTYEAECPECGNKETIKEDDDTTCPECGKTMKEMEGGKGSTDVKDDDKKVDESTKDATPFEAMTQLWANMIKNEA